MDSNNPIKDNFEEEELDVLEDVVEEPTPPKMTLKVFQYSTGLDYCLIAMGIIFNLASGVLLPLFMTVFGDLVDNLSGQAPSGHDFMWYIDMQLYLGVAAFILCGFGAWGFELAAERQLRALRSGYLRAIMRQEMGWFDTFDSGVLASQLNQNCVSLRDGIGLKLGQLFMFLGMFVAGYVVGLVQGWKMALVLTAPMPILVACGAFMMKVVGEAGTASNKGYSKAGSIAEESLAAIRSVVAFGLEQISSARFDAALEISLKDGIKSGVYKGFGLAFTLAVLFLTYALGFWYGAKLVADDVETYSMLRCLSEKGLCFTGGQAMSVFFCVIIAAFSLGQAGPSLTSFTKACGAVTEVTSLIERETKIDPYDPNGTKPDVRTFTGGIVLKQVEFAYPSRPQKCIYRSLDLEILPGKTTALVGASGCGKSTAIQLIERYYDVQSGSVLIDGIDVRDYNLKALRQSMAIVSQEPKLFAKSIAENIRCGKEDANLEEIIEAAKKANAHNFISEFPDTYDTFVGESGGQLSGGQKQRIAIARAIIRNPTILILDEATSALDNESEKIVQETLDRLIAERKRTTIVIAHRLTTIRNADRIVVFDNADNMGSRVVEQGTHDELINIENGIYRSLVASQTMSKNIDGDDDRKNSADTEIFDDDVGVPPDLAEQFIQDLPERERSVVKLRSKFSKRMSKDREMSKIQEEKKKRFWDKMKKDKKAEKGPKVSYRRVMGLLKPYWFKLCLGIIGAIMNGLVFPIFSIVFSRFITAFFQPSAQEIRDTSSKDALWFLALAAGVFVANVLHHVCFEFAGSQVMKEVRSLLFSNMLYQDMVFFDDPAHTTGSLSEILSADVGLLKGWTGDNTGIMIQNAACLTAALAISFTASVKLAGVALGGFCMLAPISMLEMKFLQASSTSSGGEDGSTDNTGYLMNETIFNMRTIAAYCLEDSMSGAYNKIVDRDYKKGKLNTALIGFLWGLSQFGQYAVQALCLWYGAQMVSKKEIGEQDMMQAIFALIMAAMGVGQTMVFATDGTKARAACSRIYAIIDRVPQVDARNPEGDKLENMKGEVRLEKVNFRYPQRLEVPVYKNLTFDIPAGKTVAMVGASGCGKSTVVQLVERFYDVGVSLPIDIYREDSKETILKSAGSGELTRSASKSKQSGGKLLVDKINIKDINVKSLRSHIGLVSQEPLLFSTTIMENIKMGREGSTDEQAIEAAKMSNAHDFIMKFPKGYSTNVGKGGSQLSGGQKQRIAIARAILRDPKILVLDEATSALDTESERIVQGALDKLLQEKGRTTIVIAHRLSTVRNADRIVVLVNSNREGSEVAEIGTHDELMQIDRGVYRGLVQLAEGKH